MKFTRLVLVFLGLFFINPCLFAATYKIDPEHSSVTFKIKHLLSYVQGSFKEFEGNFDYDPEKPETWKTKAAIQAKSIDTNVAQRDKHLRSTDFFDAEKFPALTFVSTGITDVTPGHANLKGLLTIRGVEKPVVLSLDIHGVAKDPWGNVRASFSATTTLNRKDFGLTWNKVLESGQFLVGEEVMITLEAEGLLQE